MNFNGNRQNKPYVGRQSSNRVLNNSYFYRYNHDPDYNNSHVSNNKYNKKEILDINDNSEWPSIEDISNHRSHNPKRDSNNQSKKPLNINSTNLTKSTEPSEKTINNEKKESPKLQDNIQYNAALKQVDYYFSVKNLNTDLYLRRQMDKNGWVNLDLIYQFKRVRSLNMKIDEFILSISKGGRNFEIDIHNNRIRSLNNPKKWYIPESSQQINHPPINNTSDNFYNLNYPYQFYNYPYYNYFYNPNFDVNNISAVDTEYSIHQNVQYPYDSKTQTNISNHTSYQGRSVFNSTNEDSNNITETNISNLEDSKTQVNDLVGRIENLNI